MKTFRIVVMLMMCLGFLFSISSCTVFVKSDNGQHKGWYKNSNNPHHNNSTNPGKSKGKSKNLTSKYDCDFLVKEEVGDGEQV